MTSTLHRPPTLRAYPGAMSVLAGGILLQALNMYVTTSLMPSAIADIGGEQYYAWVTSIFMIASVIAAMLTSQVLPRLGARGSFLLGFAIFALGSLTAFLTPTMEVFLIGRALQGLGAGLLSGLAFATIRRVLPEPLWARGTSIVFAMYAVGTIAGPALGGLFAQVGEWRLAFAIVAGIAVVLGMIATSVLPATPRSRPAGGIPWLALVALAAAVGALSVASVLSGMVVWIAIVVAVGLLVTFVALDRQAKGGILPKATYQRGASVKWLYVTIALSSAAVATEAFTPLFGQRMIALEPLLAGFLGATISIGWSSAGLLSARAATQTLRRRLIIAGPAVITGALLIAAATQLFPPSGWSVLAWAVALLVAGAGIGIANPHLSVAVMTDARDETEGMKASAGIPIVSQIGQVLAVAVGGILVNVAMPDVQRAAGNLFIGVAAISAGGLIAAFLAVHRTRSVGSKP